MHAYVLLCRHLWKSEIDICVFLNLSFSLFLSQLIIELVNSERASCRCPPVLGLRVHVATSGFLRGCWGTRAHILMLVWQTYPWNYLAGSWVGVPTFYFPVCTLGMRLHFNKKPRVGAPFGSAKCCVSYSFLDLKAPF